MARELRQNRVSIVIENSLWEKVKAEAEEKERSVSDFVRLVLKDYFESLESMGEEA